MDKAIITSGVKKIILRFTIVFFIVLLVLTFFSKTIDTLLLPEVTVYTPNGATITNNQRVNANITYENSKKVYPAFSYFIEDVLIEKGQTVEVGTPVAKLRDQDVQLKKDEYTKNILNLEITVSQLEEALKHWMPKVQKEATEKQLEIAQIDLENMSNEMEQYLSFVDDNNCLLCGGSGRVLSVSMNDQSYMDITNCLYEYADAETRMVMEWRMNPEQAATYDENSTLSVEYIFFETDSEDNRFERTASKDYKVSSIDLDSNTGEYVYEALVGVDAEQLFLASPELDFSLSTLTVQVNQAIPRSAIYEDANQKYVFIVNEDFTTKELTVKKTTVNIMEEYGIYCVVDREFGYGENIVLSSSKTLEHNMRVKLK